MKFNMFNCVIYVFSYIVHLTTCTSAYVSEAVGYYCTDGMYIVYYCIYTMYIHYMLCTLAIRQ